MEVMLTPPAPPKLDRPPSEGSICAAGGLLHLDFQKKSTTSFICLREPNVSMRRKCSDTRAHCPMNPTLAAADEAAILNAEGICGVSESSLASPSLKRREGLSPAAAAAAAAKP
eukprot:scaffold113004_cov32-Tisochrysis_lutea.AAC.6